MKLKGNAELETSQYYDAEGPLAISGEAKEALKVKNKKVKKEDESEDSEEFPPASTKPKKKLTKVRKKQNRLEDSSDSTSSGEFNMSSISNESINTNCSPEQLRMKTERRIQKAKKSLKGEI